MRRVALILSFGVWLLVFPAAAQTPKTGQWEPFEVTMSGGAEFPNAYVDGLPDGGKPFVVVTFTGTSGDARGLSYAVPGFWDGGNAWKVRFAAPAAGEWSYSAAASDPVLREVKGSFRCAGWNAGEKAANPTRHGFVRVARSGPRAGRYFEYADGTPFLWIGDTWWPWLRSQVLDSYRKMPAWEFSRFLALAERGKATPAIPVPPGKDPGRQQCEDLEVCVRHTRELLRTI